MQLSGSCYDSEFVVYVLTLGVLPGYRRRGLARGLVRLVVGAAQTMR